MNRLDRRFERLKREHKKAVVFFLTAGDPSLKVTAQFLDFADQRGVDCIEIGVPFSDPIADGPVIQASSFRAIGRGVTLTKILKLVSDARRRGVKVPIVLMSSFNPIFSYGVDRFAKDAQASGVDGAIVPDLPLNEASGFVRSLKPRGLHYIMMVTPTTRDARRRQIARQSTGFIYYVSLTGVTGERKRTKKGNLIPVYAEVMADLETPVSAFLKIQTGGPSFLLESVEAGTTQGRYSFLGCKPSLILEAGNGKLKTTQNGKTKTATFTGDPLKRLEEALSKYKAVAVPELPIFSGGAVGYLSYETSRFYERLPKPKGKPEFPDMIFMLADTLIVFDHLRRNMKIVSNAFVPKGASAQAIKASYQLAVDRIETLSRVLHASNPEAASMRTAKLPVNKPVSNFTPAGFAAAVKASKEYIRKGDIIQVVLSQRIKTQIECDPFDVYRSLRSLNPSPYMFYLNFGETRLIGSSPEVHVRCENGRVTLKPIAGTRPRGSSEREDETLAKELLADPKERAEHVMLVDLGRNDLGRVCTTGSVKVDELMVIERYSHVMHIVSRVTGKLRDDKNAYDVVRATFPAGTVSGAPKIRAMQIIHELEPLARGPYAGLVGYMGFSGNFDSCITIRTLFMKSKTGYIQSGAGIVMDSDPHKEWLETQNKARGVLKAIEIAHGGLQS